MVADCADSLQAYRDICFLDGNFPQTTQIADWPVIGSTDEVDSLISPNTWFFVAIGNNDTRQEWLEKLTASGAQVATLVHPNAQVSKRAAVGAGTLVLAGVVVNILVSIGKGCIINTGATIDHDCEIGDYSHIAPGTHFAGTIKTGVGVFFGVGTSVTPNLKIGNRVIVGAGSAVVRDLPDNVTAVGVPAKIIKHHEVK